MDLGAVAAAAGPGAALLGVVIAGLYAILGGKLVPAATVDRLTVQWEARLAESYQREQDWRTAAQRSEERADVTAAQLGELMTYARTTDTVLRALSAAAEARGGAPGDRTDGRD